MLKVSDTHTHRDTHGHALACCCCCPVLVKLFSGNSQTLSGVQRNLDWLVQYLLVQRGGVWRLQGVRRSAGQSNGLSGWTWLTSRWTNREAAAENEHNDDTIGCHRDGFHFGLVLRYVQMSNHPYKAYKLTFFFNTAVRPVLVEQWRHWKLLESCTLMTTAF